MNHRDITEDAAELFRRVIPIILQAGEKILDVYSEEFSVESKEDNSPITEADRRAHGIIKTGLQAIEEGSPFGGLPFLSEEGEAVPYSERREWSSFWLVDPLDGTKEFVKRNGEFTVNIALVERGIPAAGFVYLPVRDVLYFGVSSSSSSGAFKLEKASGTTLSRAEQLHPEKMDGKEGPLRIIASRSHLTEETEKFIRKIETGEGRPSETVQAGSSFKLCKIAEGEADIYPRFGPTMEWDTAAGHAVCRAAGCRVIDLSTKKEIRYNRENMRNNFFVAVSRFPIEKYIL